MVAVGVATVCRDTGTITRALGVALVVLLAAEAVDLVRILLEYVTLVETGGTTVPPAIQELAAASDHWKDVVAIAYGATYLTTACIFGRWIYVLNDNKRRLAIEPRFTPGWAVGWFFVPVASLWMPYLAMRELWQVSADPGRWHHQPVPWILPLWWCLWMGGLTFEGVVSTMMTWAGRVPGPELTNLLKDADHVEDLALCLVALALVRRISALQQGRITDTQFLEVLA